MWLLSVTEHVDNIRKGVIWLFSDPNIVGAVDLTGRIDRELLRLRGRYAYAMPGVEIQ